MKVSRKTIIIFALFLAGCGGAAENLKKQQAENQYIIHGEMKEAYLYSKRLLRSKGYKIDPDNTRLGDEISVIKGVITHAQKGLAGRVGEMLIEGITGGNTKKIVNHYETRRILVLKKRWDKTGKTYEENELGMILNGGKYGINSDGDVVEIKEMKSDSPEIKKTEKALQELTAK